MKQMVDIEGREYSVDRSVFANTKEISVGSQFEHDGQTRRHAVIIRDDGKISDRDAVMAVKPILDCWEEGIRSGEA